MNAARRGGVCRALAGIGLLLALVGVARAEAPGVGLRLLDPVAGELGFAPSLRTDIAVQVTGLVVRVKVQQRFHNPHAVWVEGVYGFPLPENAAVDRMRMVVAERLIEGEIRERSKARRQYEKAQASGQHASLLEQQRANLFTTSVANIPPGESLQIEIVYQQVLHWRDRGFELRVPTVIGPRYIPGAGLGEETARFDGQGWAKATDEVADAGRITPPVVVDRSGSLNRLGIGVDIDSGIELATLESPHHDIEVENPSLGRYRVALSDGTVPANRDFVLRWRPRAGREPTGALFHEAWQARDYGLLMLMPPDQGVPQVHTARELILVVDTSGSMHGPSLEQARAALLEAIDRLAPEDHFNLIQFNSAVESLFDLARPATAASRALARRYIEGMNADGGTEMRPAMLRALDEPGAEGRLRQVVFLTDGAVGNEQALFRLIGERLGHNRLFTVGIGSAPNTLFMRRAAEHGRGSFTYIGDTAEVAHEIAALFRQLGNPVLTDVEIEWLDGGRPVSVEQAPGAIPDLYAGEPVSLAFSAEARPDQARITGRLGGRPWQHRVRMDGGGPGGGIHALWARRNIRDWMARKTAGEDPARVRSEVLALALEHRLVSAYTSLVAVDKTPARDPESTAMHRGNVPSLLPAGWSARKVFGKLPSTATPSGMFAVAGVLLLVMAGWFGRRAA